LYSKLCCTYSALGIALLRGPRVAGGCFYQTRNASQAYSYFRRLDAKSANANSLLAVVVYQETACFRQATSSNSNSNDSKESATKAQQDVKEEEEEPEDEGAAEDTGIMDGKEDTNSSNKNRHDGTSKTSGATGNS
jgi:hypothetical protein